MKSMTAEIIVTVAAAMAIALGCAEAGETEGKIFTNMKKQASDINQTLDKFETFKKSYAVAGSHESRTKRHVVLRKVAYRLRQQANELAKKAEQMELHLTMTEALESDDVETERTKESIDNLKNEIEQLKKQLEKKRQVKSGVQVAAK